jgi:hypothetical protein
MVAHARGLPFDQTSAADEMFGSRRGYALRDLADLLGPGAQFTSPDPTHPATLPYIEAQLASGAWVIAQVFTQELVASMQRSGTAPTGPYGPLTGLLHCIVLVDSDGVALQYFDPYFFATGQPLSVDRVSLALLLQADLIVAR